MHRALALGVAVNVVVVTIVAIGLFGFHVTPAFAQQTDTLAPLQGRWMVTAGEHNGAPMDALNGGVMAIDGAAFEISTASGNVLTGTFEVEASMRPKHLDLLHANGTRWEAVFEVDGTVLRLNYVDASGVDPRPTGFKTLPTNEESLIVLNREGQ